MYGDFVVRVGADLTDFKAKMDELQNSIKQMRELSESLDKSFNTENITKFSQAIEGAATSMEKMSAAANAISNSVTTISEATTKVANSSEGINKLATSMESMSKATQKTEENVRKLGDSGEQANRRVANSTKEASDRIQTMDEYVNDLIRDMAAMGGQKPVEILNKARMDEFTETGNAFKRGIKDAFNVESLAGMLSNILGNGGAVSRAMSVGIRSGYNEMKRLQAESKKYSTEDTDAVRLAKKGSLGPDVQAKTFEREQAMSAAGLVETNINGRGGGYGRTAVVSRLGGGAVGGFTGSAAPAPAQAEAPQAESDPWKAVADKYAAANADPWQALANKSNAPQEAVNNLLKTTDTIAKAVDKEAGGKARTLVDGITSKISGMLDGLKGAAGGLLSKIPGGDALGGLLGKAGGAIGGLLGKAGGALGGLAGGLGGAASALGGIGGMALGPVGSIAMSAVGGAVGSLVAQAPAMLMDALSGAAGAAMEFGAELQRSEFNLKKAFGEGSTYMSQQAGKISEGTMFDDSDISGIMTKLGLSLGDKLGDEQIASLTGTTAKMATLMGGDTEQASQLLSMTLMTGQSRTARQLKMQTGIDLSDDAVMAKSGIDEKEWKKMSEDEQMQKRIELLNDPEVVKRLEDLNKDYMETIDGQKQLLEKNKKQGAESMKVFNQWGTQVLKAQNGIEQVKNGMIEPFVNNLKDVLTDVGKSTGIGEMASSVTTGLFQYNDRRGLQKKVKEGTATEEEKAKLEEMNAGATGTTKQLWEILDKVYEAWDKISNIIFNVIRLVGDIYKGLTPVWNIIKAIVSGGIEYVAKQFGVVSTAVNKFIAIFRTLFQIIGDPTKSIGEKLMNIGQLIIVALGTLIKTIISLFANAIKFIIDILAGGFKLIIDIWSLLQQIQGSIIAAGWNLIIDIIKAGGGILCDLIDTILSFIGEIFSGNWQGILDGVTGFLWGIVSAVASIGKSIIDAAVGIGKGIWDAIAGSISGVLDWGKGILGGAWDAVAGALGLSGGGSANETATGAGNEAKSALEALAQQGADSAANIGKDNKKSLKDSFNALMDGFKLDPNALNAGFVSTADMLKGGIDAIAGGLKGGVDLIEGGLNGTVDALVQMLAGDMVDAVKENEKGTAGSDDSIYTDDDTGGEPAKPRPPPTITPKDKDDLTDAIKGLKDTVDGKKMDSKIEIFITQTFEGPVDKDALRLAGQTAEAAVIAALQKKGVVPS